MRTWTSIRSAPRWPRGGCERSHVGPTADRGATSRSRWLRRRTRASVRARRWSAETGSSKASTLPDRFLSPLERDERRGEPCSRCCATRRWLHDFNQLVFPRRPLPRPAQNGTKSAAMSNKPACPYLNRQLLRITVDVPGNRMSPSRFSTGRPGNRGPGKGTLGRSGDQRQVARSTRPTHLSTAP